jgi:D-alanine-D-alanine ligase
VARIDFRLRQGVPYFLEANPLPGLNPDSSDLVIMAGLLGWTYPELLERILSAALERSRGDYYSEDSAFAPPLRR